MNTPIITKHFEDWMTSVFGPGWRRMPEIERTERERAFVSGFASYYFFAMALTDLTDDKAEARLKELAEEIRVYFARMQKEE